MPSIYILPIEFQYPDILDYLGKEIHKELGLNVEIEPSFFDILFAYNSSREQYNSTLFLSKLLQYVPEDHSKIIGITTLDLFIPVLTFVFGEAQLNGKAAVVSSYRLHNEFYGLPPNDKLFRERLLKETIHELGHTFGRVHCRQQDCALHPSTYVEEIDLKTSHFCIHCKDAIQENIKSGGTVVRRFDGYD